MSDKTKLVRPATITSAGIVEHLDQSRDSGGHDTAQVRIANAEEPHDKIVVNKPLQCTNGEPVVLHVGSEVAITVSEQSVPNAS